MNLRSSPALLAVTAMLLLPTPARAQTSPAGTWAQLVSTTAVSRVPVVGVVTTRTRVYSLATLEEDEQGLRMTTTNCWVRMDGDIDEVRPIVPSAMVEAMGPKTRRGRWSSDAGTITVRFPAAVDVLGARLAHPRRDPLPTDIHAPTVFDEDGDGFPGVTVRMIGLIDGDLRVVQRTVNALDGVMTADADTITGRVTWRSEQNVLEATSAFLRASPSSRPHPDPDRSRFVMKRVPASLDCDGLLKDHARLFP